MVILLTLLAYFAALLLLSRLTARRSDNDTFFRAGRRSPWHMVAFGMVGASISGITFISVPGMVIASDMTYLQMCMGFIVGYLVIAFVLLPVYYRQRLTTIYACLLDRIGPRAYKTGAAFFLLSKTTGAAVRFYVVCAVLQHFVFDAAGVPFAVTVVAMVALIWLYTRRGGIRTLVFTDTFQTLCMLTALIVIIHQVVAALHLSPGEAVTAIMRDPHSRVFEFSDWMSRQHFCKQFLSGAFVAIVMTGLDQDMMQKNLTCKTLRDAQKNMCCYGCAFVPVNLLFLSLGVLLLMLASQRGIALPAQGDNLLPMFTATGALGTSVVVLFTLGVVASAFSSADSALTALTTTFCVDLAGRPSDERLRRRAHVAIAAVFVLFILAFKAISSASAIDAIYTLCSYTYGPLLGLFAYALLARRPSPAKSMTRPDRPGADHAAPLACIAAPLVCLALDRSLAAGLGYHLGYELLMLNGALTYLALWLAGRRKAGRTASRRGSGLRRKT